jgi:hypothetical protein
MTGGHDQLRGAGRNTHHQIDLYLPTSGEKSILRDIAASAPVEVTGARDDPEAALANLLAALESLGLLTDSTTAT